jgi:hypothetical protein
MAVVQVIQQAKVAAEKAAEVKAEVEKLRNQILHKKTVRKICRILVIFITILTLNLNKSTAS